MAHDVNTFTGLISKPSVGRYTLYTVKVEGYQQVLSFGYFRSRCLTAGYKAYRTYAGYAAYDHLPTVKHPSDELISISTLPSLYTIVQTDYTLYEFYKVIGYDNKKAKLEGRTFAKHIKHFWKLTDPLTLTLT